jgi:hypothetical protein
VSVVVALVTLHSDGIGHDVGIIESPSPAVADDVTRALRRWKFNWRSEEEADVFKGRLTFYIVHGNGETKVFNSDVAPSFAELRLANHSQ